LSEDSWGKAFGVNAVDDIFYTGRDIVLKMFMEDPSKWVSYVLICSNRNCLIIKFQSKKNVYDDLSTETIDVV